ncbi:DMT family transporter [Halobacillus trueperi]|uniref:DMT family transporter n=1 Tax=Halobacillus trueperi TaxID=156205 RepID=UPI0037358B29
MYPYILLIFVVIFYAGNILTGKALNDLPPFTIAYLRLLVAFLILLPVGYQSARKATPTFFQYYKPLLVMTVTGVAFFNTFIYASLKFTTATNVSVLETLIPVLTVILSTLILKENISALQVAGIALSLLGAWAVVMNGNLFYIADLGWNIGDGIMVGAIICWAVYSLVVKKVMTMFPSLGTILVMTGLSLVILLPFVTVEWLVYGFPPLWNLSTILGLIYLGVFPSFIALLFYNTAVERLGASKASVFLNLLPVVTMTGAYFLLGENVSVAQVIGALLVILGVVMTTQPKVLK